MPRKACDDAVVGKIFIESENGELIRPWGGTQAYLTNETDLGQCLVVKNSKHKTGQGIFFRLGSIRKVFGNSVRDGKMSLTLSHLERKHITMHIQAAPESVPDLEKLYEMIASRSLWHSIPMNVSKSENKRTREAHDRRVELEDVASEDARSFMELPSSQTFPLSEEQEEALERLRQGEHIFLTGCAGTGKTFLLQHLVTRYPSESICVTASTAIAAIEIGGQTLHSFAGVGASSEDLTLEQMIPRIIQRPNVSHAWRKCKKLIIDEISMVSCQFFDLLDKIGRTLKKQPEKPFGGIQMILAGDFFQLPPVIRRKHHDGKVFCFESDAWSYLKPHVIELKHVFRQSDETLVKALADLRKGVVTERASNTFSPCIGRQLNHSDGVYPTSLRSMTHDVDTINTSSLQILTGESVTYEAQDNADSEYIHSVLRRETYLPETITLKVGAQVVLLAALPHIHRSLVSGSRGVVVGLAESASPVVRFAVLDADVRVERIKREVLIFSKVVAHREQIPLRLAWALSIHKSQGMSIDRLEVSIDRTVFEYGQAYVALSRCVSLHGLSITQFDSTAVRAHPKVLDFFSSIAGS